MARLLIKHPELRPYRIPFFQRVSRHHDIRLMLNKEPTCQSLDYCVIGTAKSSMWSDAKSLRIFLHEMLRGQYAAFVSTNPTASATIVGVLLAKARRKKVILWDESWLFEVGGWRGRLKQLLTIGMYRWSDALFASGSRTRDFALQVARLPAQKVFFSPQCNLDLAKVTPAKPPPGIAQGAVVFLYFGRIFDLKGLDYLIRAFSVVESRYADTFLLMVGDGPERDACHTLAEELNLRNYAFHNSIPDGDNAAKAALYATSDVFVVPSRRIGNHCEGWGLVVGEAMSMAKPVIVTDAVGSVRDLIEEGVNGHIVKHSRVEDLAMAMEKMIRQRRSLPAMGKASRKIFEQRISYDKMAQEFLRAVDFALRKSG